MALSKQKRIALAAAGGAVVLLAGGLALAAGRKKTVETDEDGIDLDAIPEPIPGGAPPAIITDTRDSDAEEAGTPYFPSPSPVVPTVSPGVVPTVPIPGVTVPEVTLPDLTGEIDLSELPVPGVTLPSERVPLPTAPSPEPVLAAADALSVKLLADLKAAEKLPGWKRTYPVVKQWQQAHGRVADSKFGPKDAVYLAGITGDVPVIRYWPAESGKNPKSALADYFAALTLIGDEKPFLAAGIARTMQREKGQSFGPPQGDGGKAPIL